VILFVSTAFVDEPNRIFWWDALWQMFHWTSRRRVHVAGQWVYPLRTIRERTRASREIAESLKTLAPGQRAACVERLAEQLDVAPRPTRAVLSWAELRGLAAEGVAVAGHSRTHELLDQIDDEALRREVAGCRADLQRELGYCQPLFAYPNGNVDKRSVAAIDAAGFRAGFTTAPGLNRLCTSDARLLRRDDGRVSPIRLVLNLLGPVARARAMRHPQPGHLWTGSRSVNP
jgi:peptidoglycan/xylan/chitin deacetylase (PgdA/CDA1 family)